MTLDVWHTLLFLEPAAEDAYNSQQMQLGTTFLEGSPSLGAGVLAPAEAFRSVFFEAIRLAGLGESVPPDRQILRAAALAGRTVDPARYISRLDQLAASAPFRVAPGARDALAELAEDGIRIGVVSNTVGETGRALQRICDLQGLGRYITAWSWSDELPWTKPSAEIFRHCLCQLGAVPSTAVHVGDGASDIEGARRAGFRSTVLYSGLGEYGQFYRRHLMSTDPHRLNPDHVLTSLSRLPELVRQTFGGDVA